MNNLLRTLVDLAMKIYVEPAVDMAKLKATIYYLEVIKVVRLIVILVCILLFVLMLFGAGLILIPVAIVYWAPWTPETKLLVSLIVGAVYLIVPILAVVILMSEKRWMRLTRADRLVQTIISQQLAQRQP